MRCVLGILVLLLASCASTEIELEDKRGALVLVGGGRTPRPAVFEALTLAGGLDARVVIIPWASQSDERGLGSVDMYRQLGATNARNLDNVEPALLLDAIQTADLIWMPGGSQSRLMSALREHGLVEAIRAAHARGCVVGGTSAGAAVAGDIMIAGAPSETGIRSGISKLEPGLGLWPGVIVDQHFTQRRRQSRLLSAILEGPSRVGIGISERTALIVHGSTRRVIGDGAVLVYDARDAKLGAKPEAGMSFRASGIRLDVETTSQ